MRGSARRLAPPCHGGEEIGLGNAPDETASGAAERDGHAVALVISEVLERLADGGLGRDGEEGSAENVARQDQLAEFAGVQVALDVVQRNRAAEIPMLIGDVEVIEAMRDEA